MVAVVAPQASSLLGLVSVVAPVIVTGNAAVVAASRRPLPAITLSEVLATSDVPAASSTFSPELGGHRALAGVPHGRQRPSISPVWPATPTCAGDLEISAAENLKRVLRAPDEEPDWTRAGSGRG